ncbi:MAG: hypothetical protein KIT84_21555 [Labilithrix sp.]|nr:hypothetical protein [Labilithrix sp.]MCW5813631.1 hypothetical protein [Labilithrix sp.]
MNLRVGAALVLALSLATSAAGAQSAAAPTEEAQKEANTHFQRAVTLYSEADYRGALVEFKRAYEIAPHVQVLYNIGQAYYQNQSYAEALTTFERFLAEGGQGHKEEVERAIVVLKTRVGKIDVSTPTPGWDLTLDDEPVGKTPLAKPLAVSIGRRKLVATKAGEAPQTKFVEVSAGETKAVTFDAGHVAPPPPPPRASAPEQEGPVVPHKRSPLYTVGWVTAGALAAGAVVTGILAVSSADDLDQARNTFPGNARDIDSKASTTTALSVTTDALAASAIIVGGVTLYFTLTRPKSPKAAGTTVRVGGGPGSLILGGTF